MKFRKLRPTVCASLASLARRVFLTCLVRSTISYLRRGGVDTTTTMQIIGHKSPLRWKRHNSVAESYLITAANRFNTYLSNTLITPDDPKLVPAYQMSGVRLVALMHGAGAAHWAVCKCVRAGEQQDPTIHRPTWPYSRESSRSIRSRVVRDGALHGKRQWGRIETGIEASQGSVL